AVGRRLTEERVRKAAAKGPFIASEARDAGLLDGTAFDDELDRSMQELVGQKVSVDKYSEETVAPAMFGSPSKVAIVYIEGDMIDGRSSHIPLVDIDFVGSYSIADTLNSVKDDAS